MARMGAELDQAPQSSSRNYLSPRSKKPFRQQTDGPVEGTRAKNSVTPSTTPRITALIESEIMMGFRHLGEKAGSFSPIRMPAAMSKNEASGPSIWNVR